MKDNLRQNVTRYKEYKHKASVNNQRNIILIRFEHQYNIKINLRRIT